MIELATCSYSEYRTEMGAAVRTSIGHPRFFSYRPLLSWESVYPERHWLNLPIEDYLPRYLSKLDGIGTETLRGDIDTMSRSYADLTGSAPERLVLLCYEGLRDPEKWCHRTMLADYLSYNLEVEVKEIGATPEPSLW